MSCIPSIAQGRSPSALGRRLRRRADRPGPHVRPVRATGSWWPRSTPTTRSTTASTSSCTTTFAQPEADHDEIEVLVDNPRARKVVVYTWNFHPDLVASATRKGANGYLSKTLPARDLVAALEAIHAGEVVVSPDPGKAASRGRARLARPQRGPDQPGVGDPRPHHPGQEQRRGRRADLPQHELDQDLHPLGVPQDRRREPHPGRAVGRRARLHARPPPHRPLARRTITSAMATTTERTSFPPSPSGARRRFEHQLVAGPEGSSCRCPRPRHDPDRIIRSRRWKFRWLTRPVRRTVEIVPWNDCGPGGLHQQSGHGRCERVRASSRTTSYRTIQIPLRWHPRSRTEGRSARRAR